jgi:hypothetical protein
LSQEAFSCEEDKPNKPNKKKKKDQGLPPAHQVLLDWTTK